MRDFRTVSLWQRAKRLALGLDSAIDAGLYDSWQRSRASWERFVTFMDRFHVTGWRKLVVNLACDGLTLSILGLFIMLALAQTAMQATANPHWLKQQDLAVTFLDRHGQEIGRRGIRRDDSVSLDDYPDQLIEAVIAMVTGRKVFDDKIFYFPEIPTLVEPWMLVWVTLGAISIAVLASVLPARRAARLRPVEALRYE